MDMFSKVFESQPWLIGVVIAIVIVALITKGQPRSSNGKRKKSQGWGWSNSFNKYNIWDPRVQLTHISKVDFQTQKLLNKGEYRALVILEKVTYSQNRNYRVMAQTSLGEILKPKPKSGTKEELNLAYRSINSKRLDFAVFDRSGNLILAVEYQGSGHYHQQSFMRDAVKREALRKAGVHLFEIEAEFDPQFLEVELRAFFEKISNRNVR